MRSKVRGEMPRKAAASVRERVITTDVGLSVMEEALVGGSVCGGGAIKRPAALGGGGMCVAGGWGVLVGTAGGGLELIGHGLARKQARYLFKRICDTLTGSSWSCRVPSVHAQTLGF